MGYADINFYKETYRGTSIPDTDIQKMLERASEDIDMLTRMRIKKLGGFSQLSDFEKVRVQLAVCAQADYKYERGQMEGISSFNIGDVSVSFEASKEYDAGCLSYLNSTRLMYRGL